MGVSHRRERARTHNLRGPPALILLHLHLIWGMNYGPIQLIRASTEDRCCWHFLRRATKADLAQISNGRWYFLAPRQTGRQFFGPRRDSHIYSQHPAAALGARACLKITPGWKKTAGHFFKFLVLRARTYLGAVFFLFTIVEWSLQRRFARLPLKMS